MEDSVVTKPGDRPQDAGGKRISFRLTVSVVLVGSILVVAAAMTTANWYYSSRNVRALVDRILNGAAARVVDRTLGYLKPAEDAARLSRELAASGVVRARDVAQLEAFFLHVAKVYPSVAMLNFGDELGDFVMVKRFPTDFPVEGARKILRDRTECRVRVPARMWPGPGQPPCLGPPIKYVVPRGSLGTKVVFRGGLAVGARSSGAEASPFVLWRYRNLEGRLDAVWFSERPVYDPRVRPWYEQAKTSRRQGWTGVYLFFTDRKPGIGSASPIFSRTGRLVGVVNVEVELYAISEFLATLKVGRHGKVFLADSRGRTVGYPEPDKLRRKVVRDGRETWELTPLEEIPDSQVAESYVLLRKQVKHHLEGPVDFSFEQDEKTYWAHYEPLRGKAGRGWVVGIVVPESDFLGAVRRNRKMNLLGSVFLALLATVLGLVVARWISNPLRDLAHQADRIRNLDLTSGQVIRSRIRDVDDLGLAMERMRTSLKSFAKYVPKDLVRQLVASGKEAELEGERRVCTILFSDIQGFTSIAESTPPEALVQDLSDYFKAATKVLLEHGATIDKFIGDAIMAFWGAPAEVSDHAGRACEAALAVQRRLAELNETWTRQGKRPFLTRIGLHTGEVIVGNIGSEDRINYTIVGDAVNLASRLEGINKVYGTYLCISEETYKGAGDRIVARVLDVVAVKGKSEGVRIYELRGLAGGLDEAEERFVALCDRAFSAYLARQFSEAKGLWMEADALVGGDPASQVMIARCEEYIQAPPGEEWNGVYVAKSK